jgi:hypothetical protein
LESLAGRFDHILPTLDRARAVDAADVVAAWEAAVVQLVMCEVISPHPHHEDPDNFGETAVSASIEAATSPKVRGS